MKIRQATKADRRWLAEQSASIGGPKVVSQGELHDLASHPSLIAEVGGHDVGFATYRVHGRQCELLAIKAISQWAGTGSRLLTAVEEVARVAGCATVYLSTTNDNVDALRFYQRRGYHLAKLNRGEFDVVLKLKGIRVDEPVMGQHQIVIRDELVLEKTL